MSRTRTPFIVTGFPACAKAIVPSNIAPLLDFNNNPRPMTVYVGTAGVVRVLPIGNTEGNDVSFVVPTGGLIPVEVSRVYASGTDATDLVGLF